MPVDLAARNVDEDAAEQEDGQQDADDGAQGDGGSVRLPRREYGAFTYNNNKMLC